LLERPSVFCQSDLELQINVCMYKPWGLLPQSFCMFCGFSIFLPILGMATNIF
jgi:hypothetical protein